MSYRVTGYLIHREAETFEEALEVYAALVERNAIGPLRIANTDRMDFCTLTGWDDGLSESEREMVDNDHATEGRE